MIQGHHIIVLAKEVVTLRPRNGAVTAGWPASLAFFSPANVRRFLELYWAIWHPNVNLVNRPTFDPAVASPTMLAAMSMVGETFQLCGPSPHFPSCIYEKALSCKADVETGACMSPSPADRRDARLWSNRVDEMVFTDDELCSEPLYSLDTGVWDPTTQKRKVQALPASYIVCLYQNWEGTDSSKRRLRRYRLGTGISLSELFSLQ